jgi:hypothetical protein
MQIHLSAQQHARKGVAVDGLVHLCSSAPTQRVQQTDRVVRSIAYATMLAGSASVFDRNRGAIECNIALLFCQRHTLTCSSVSGKRRYTILKE